MTSLNPDTIIDFAIVIPGLPQGDLLLKIITFPSSMLVTQPPSIRFNLRFGKSPIPDPTAQECDARMFNRNTAARCIKISRKNAANLTQLFLLYPQ